MTTTARELLQQAKEALSFAVAWREGGSQKARAAIADIDAYLSEPGFDECVASGQSCQYGPHGRKGEMQCKYCGKEKPDSRQAAAQPATSFDTDAVYARMEQLMPNWNGYGKSREGAVAVALTAVRELLAATPPAGERSTEPTDEAIKAVADELFDHQEIAGRVPAMDRDAFREIIGAALAAAAVRAGERSTPAEPRPITPAQATKMWHEDCEAHKRVSAFEWFAAGILAAESHHGIKSR